MPRYIAIHPHACAERDLRRLTARHDEMPEDTLWNRSWCGVNKPVAYCDWEAADEQAVARVLGAFRVPYSAIHRVTYFRGDAPDGLAARVRVCHDGNGSPRRFIAVHPVSLEEEPLKRLVNRWREELPVTSCGAAPGPGSTHPSPSATGRRPARRPSPACSARPACPATRSTKCATSTAG